MVAKQARTEANDGFDPTYGRIARQALEPGHVPTLFARVRSGQLDRALIAGSNPARSPQLAARAAALTSRRSRASLADGLERLLRAAEARPTIRRVQPRRRELLANAVAVRELVDVLRGAYPLYAAGVALVNRLLTDGTGPAYAGGGEPLGRALWEARDALRGGSR
ncbi:MAG TPA: hypothetical protein VNZ01_09000 [Solirubrobacteraceae bacterium]|jgi:hypothetical protein|nr:hypothetical protein [Solirubrobacteraceae bacterium]